MHWIENLTDKANRKPITAFPLPLQYAGKKKFKQSSHHVNIFSSKISSVLTSSKHRV